MKLITVAESVVNAIVEYHAQGSEEAHAEGNRMFLRYLPRGLRVTEPTFGPSGRQLRLNCWAKNRR